MTLDKGNWAYAPTPKTLDRTRDLMETYSSDQGEAKSNPYIFLQYKPELDGYLNYVRFMVRHFMDRVKYFEVQNAWGLASTYEEAMKYTQILRPAIKIIRKEFPEAKIMPSSDEFSGSSFDWYKALGDARLLTQVDVLGFHGFYDTPPTDPHLISFPQNFARFKKMVEGYGFKGEYMCTEWEYASRYPPFDLDEPAHSEMQKAVYASRVAITYAHLGIINLWNETFQTRRKQGLSLFRNTVSGEVICPTQPEPAYYMLRTLCTVLANVKGTSLPVTFTNRWRQIQSCGFILPNGEKLIAFWLPGDFDEHDDGGSTLITGVVIKGEQSRGASIIDILNGTERPLNGKSTSDSVLFEGIHAQGWPLIIRLTR
jgi:hypothetical protein